MSNRRRRQAPLTWEEWQPVAVLAGLDLLAASGCGESGSDGINGLHVHVLVTCRDPDCPECSRSAPPARPLAAEDGTDGLHSGCRMCQQAAGA